MRLLIDSHIAIWIFDDDKRLGSSARSLLTNSKVYFSSATPWELGIKRAKGRLQFDGAISQDLIGYGFVPLSISIAHAEEQEQLAAHHGDPFDRIIIAQAIVENLPVMSADRTFSHYPVEVIHPTKTPV